jgi:uncharacterized protein YcgL (UPF0745 family)
MRFFDEAFTVRHDRCLKALCSRWHHAKCVQRYQTYLFVSNKRKFTRLPSDLFQFLFYFN